MGSNAKNVAIDAVDAIARFGPLVTSVLGLLSLANPPVAAAAAAAALAGSTAGIITPPGKDLEVFAKKAVTDYGEVLRQRANSLDEGDQLVVEARLRDSIQTADRLEVLTAALQGPDAFRKVILGDESVAFEGLSEVAEGYFKTLVNRTHELVLEYTYTPAVFSRAATAALLDMQAALKATSAALAQVAIDDQQERHVLQEQMVALKNRFEAVAAELARRPAQMVVGSRPRVAAGYVARDETGRLVTALASEGVASICALEGMRGVGKTQLAARYAEDCLNNGWVFVGWVTAANRDQALSQLADIARDPLVRVAEATDPTDRAAHRLVQWLSGSGPAPRLLVFDNVEDPHDVADLIPVGPGMRTLLTTTSRTGALGTPIDIDVYTPGQAVDYLVSATGDPDRDGAARVAEDLGRLPVALTQAATAITWLGHTYHSYHHLLESTPALDDAVRRDTADPYPHTVGVALRTGYKGVLAKLAQTSQPVGEAASAVLDAVVLMAQHGVPRDWLYRLTGDETAGREAVGALLRTSLLTESADRRTIAAHRLLQQVIREDISDSTLMAEAVRHAVSALTAVDPNVNWEHRHVLTDLKDQLVAIGDQPYSRPLLKAPETLSTALDTAHNANQLDQPATAVALAPYVALQAERLGPDHPDTLASRNNLAYAYKSAGDLGRAIPLFQQTLTERERVLGADHPDTLTSRNNLASAYRSAGDLGRALPLFQQTLTDAERVLGADHPDTLASRNNLAYAYRSAGDLGLAIPLYQQNLTDAERVLGADHPTTITCRNNLASAYRSAGDLDRAIPLHQQTLTDRERVLGPDHPDTLTSRNNLAYAYRSAGDLDRAIPLFQQTLTDRERVLSPDHPDTLTSRNNLAYAYKSAGDLGLAIPLYQQTLTDRERVLSPDHPDTLTSRNNLAHAYQSAGDLDRAIPLFQQTLTDRERVLSPDHPDTLASRNNLAYAYESAGDLGRAIPLYQQTLTDAERVLGADHPNTLTSRNNLAHAYQSAGDLDRAIPLYQQNLTERERVLGADHPDTLTSRNNLAYAYQSAGDLGRAIPLFQQNLTDAERVLGADHPDTLTCRNNLAYAYESAGDLGLAIPLYQQTLTDRERVLGADHPNDHETPGGLAGSSL